MRLSIMIGVTLEAAVAIERPLNPPYWGSPRCKPIVRVLGAASGLLSAPDCDSPGGAEPVQAVSAVTMPSKSPQALTLGLIVTSPACNRAVDRAPLQPLVTLEPGVIATTRLS